jgi:hypothetical protein
VFALRACVRVCQVASSGVCACRSGAQMTNGLAVLGAEMTSSLVRRVIQS